MADEVLEEDEVALLRLPVLTAYRHTHQQLCMGSHPYPRHRARWRQPRAHRGPLTVAQGLEEVEFLGQDVDEGTVQSLKPRMWRRRGPLGGV